MMECPSSCDFFLKFKALLDDRGHFVDYILEATSCNFPRITNVKRESIIGKKLSEIVIEYENDIIGIKDIYFNTIPKTIKKFENYMEESDKWYSITIFSDDTDYMLIFYSDITRIKKSTKTLSNIKSKINILDMNTNVLCYRDKLTGLYNADFFKEELVRLDSRRQLPISIIMGDLNGLKLINDAFGHITGDNVLIKASEIMKKVFRKEDLISRVGGDEFLILLPKTPKSTAQKILNRIRTECKNNPLDFIQISISFGLATKEKEEESLMDIYKKAESNMYFNKLTESKAAKLSIIEFLMSKLEEVSAENKAHFERLNNLSQMMANALGLSEIDKRKLKLLCEYHDIGKIAIPTNILHKKEALNNTEWEKIRSHSEVGYHIIAASRETLVIDELILMHHERWDGEGYPGLIKGEEIPITVRVFSIADAYESMVNDRPYRERMSNKRALKEIEAEAGTQFDPDIAALFIDLMEKVEIKAI